MSPTVAERHRMNRFRDVGCVACYKRGIYMEPDVHHLLSGGRRRGHRFTIPLCPGHHRAVFPYGYKDFREVHGPSMAKEPRAFRAEFGTDEELLKLTDELLERIG